ncbi:basic proline-rich protein-like [Colius striatus]|uniref:basic proline-rich protein-like n=1 Tax=Colius striatus TaxID=57412 RepID=UPI002B1DA1A1|nr:basic proline-rich protein-like [Colius striatus]
MPAARSRPSGYRSTEHASAALLPVPPTLSASHTTALQQPQKPVTRRDDAERSSRGPTEHTATPPHVGQPPSSPHRAQAPQGATSAASASPAPLPRIGTAGQPPRGKLAADRGAQRAGSDPVPPLLPRSSSSHPAAPRLSAGKRPLNFPSRALEASGHRALGEALMPQGPRSGYGSSGPPRWGEGRHPCPDHSLPCLPRWCQPSPRRVHSLGPEPEPEPHPAPPRSRPLPPPGSADPLPVRDPPAWAADEFPGRRLLTAGEERGRETKLQARSGA